MNNHEKYNIKLASEVNIDALSTFYKLAYPDRHKLIFKYMKWYYRTSLFNLEPLVIEIDNEIVGHAGMMSSYLNELGLIPWFSETVKNIVPGTSWVLAFLVLILIYFYSHYFFASNTAHVNSMYMPFLAVAVAVGTPAVLAALVLAFFSNLFSSMTHYGTGPAPVFYGAGYVDMNTWWKLGFLISLVNIVIWVGIGGLWWKVLGLW